MDMSIYHYLLSSLFLLTQGCTMTETIGGWISKEEMVDPPAELVDFMPNLELVELWKQSTGSGTNNQYLNLAPIIAKQRVYIADAQGSVITIDVTNGKKLWTHKIEVGDSGFWSSGENIKITGGPGYGEDTILIGTSEGDVIAIDADIGKELWRSKVSSEILSTPQKQEGIVIIRTLDGKLFGLEGSNGKLIWTYDRSVPALTLRGTSSPIINQGIVICGFDGGRLAAVELTTGRVLWETAITTARGRNELERMVDIDSDPVIIDGIIYAVTFQGQLAAMALDTGRILWTRDISSYAGFSIDQQNIYVTDDKSIIWAYDRYSGSSVWKQDNLYNRAVTAPANIGSYIVVGDFEGYLHWMYKINGAFAARTQLSDERFISAPISFGRMLYAYSSDGKLAALTYR